MTLVHALVACQPQSRSCRGRSRCSQCTGGATQAVHSAQPRGWLATLPVLEPHWQVLMAHGLATGHIQWGHDKRMDFNDAPLYSEKNWGNGFPKRWAWVQCNSFDVKDVCVTGVFALRNLLGVPGLDEAVGLIGVHHNGRFIELTPANGEVSWDVAPWGKWLMRGKSADFEAELEAECDDDAGAVLRAPLGEQGLAEACKDTFAGAHRPAHASDLKRADISVAGGCIDRNCRASRQLLRFMRVVLCARSVREILRRLPLTCSIRATARVGVDGQWHPDRATNN